MKTILSILFRRKREAVIFAICMIIFPVGISYTLTEKYESTATVMLTAGRFKKPFIPNEKDTQTGFIQISMEDMASEVELLTSLPVLEKVVEKNKLYVFPEPGESEYLKRFAAAIKKGINGFLVLINLKKEMTDFEVAVAKLSGDVDVEFIKRSNIISIKWRGYSPSQAKNVVNTMVHEYIKHHIDVHGYTKAFKVIKKEMDLNQQRVRDVENELNQLEAQFGSYDLDMERTILIEKYLTAKMTYDNLLHIDPDSVSSTNRGLYAEDPNFVGLMKELTELEMERMTNVVSYGAKNKRVTLNDQQIKNLKKLIKSEHLHNLESWKESGERYRKRLDEFETVRERASLLKRDLVRVLDAYQISRQKYNEAMISAAMDKAEISSVLVVAPASYTSTPAYPRKILLLVISIFFAIIGGIAAAFSAEKMFSRIVSIEDILAYTKLKVLLTIPEFTHEDQLNGQWLMNSLSKKMAAMRRFLSEDGANSKVHLVVSPSPGAGTSFAIRQLSHYAQRTTKTKSLLFRVDYAVQKVAGVTIKNILSDPKKSIKRNNETDYVTIQVSPDELSSDNSSFSLLLEQIKSLGYGNIFIDLPNERGDSSYLNVTSCCDHLFVNVAYDITDKYALKRFVSVIETHSAIPTSGAIFNRRKNPIPHSIYKRL
jgi:uncharacterized protein involved in exopolysaccharide biosynthesis